MTKYRRCILCQHEMHGIVDGYHSPRSICYKCGGTSDIEMQKAKKSIIDENLPKQDN